MSLWGWASCGHPLGEPTEEPDCGSSDECAPDEEHLEGKEGQRPEQLKDDERGPEEGGHKDSDPTEEDSEDGADPQHVGSMRLRRAS